MHRQAKALGGLEDPSHNGLPALHLAASVGNGRLIVEPHACMHRLGTVRISVGPLVVQWWLSGGSVAALVVEC